MTTDSITGLSESNGYLIKVDTEEYQLLIDFFNSNTGGWKSTPASYVCDLSLSQDDFRLLYWIGKDGVVIVFTNSAGDSKQYYKTIKLGELDFLIE